MLGSLLEQLLYKNKGWVLDDVPYRHGSSGVPILENIGAGEQINTEAYVIMNDVIFGLAVSYTVPAGKTFNIMKIMIDATAIAVDGDVVFAIYADSTPIFEINVPQNVGHYEQSYPVCREFAETEVITVYAKSLAENTDKTFNVTLWGLSTS